MQPRRFSLGLALALGGALLVACATPKERFLHVAHRENFSLQDDEIRGLQFFISKEVLAKDAAAESSASGVLIVARDTPGRALDVGPDWIRVSFEEGGAGVYFAAQDNLGRTAYWLATRDDSDDLRVLKDMNQKVIRVAERKFEIVYGGDAQLLVDGVALRKLIDTRARAKGRSP